MAGKKGRTPNQEELNRRAELVIAALDAGAISQSDILAACDGITIQNLRNLFNDNPTVRAKYLRNLASLKTVASSNLIETMMDTNNPKNWEATKFFLGRYKTELDEVLEKDTDEVKIKHLADGSSNVTINFTPQNKGKGED